MKSKRLLFLIMAICLASGVKAQFYDSADDIYYYVCEYDEKDEYIWSGSIFDKGYYTGKKIQLKHEGNDAKVLIFNFDGTKAALLCSNNATVVREVKSNIGKTPSYYEDKVETTDYTLRYEPSSTSGVTYKKNDSESFIFSSDRNTLRELWTFTDGSHPCSWVYKRVDKSYFKVGRSRNPRGTMYE